MKIKDKNVKWCNKISTKMSKWIGNGGWITICIIGAFGVIMASSGMIMHLINFWHEDKVVFFSMLFVGLIVWGAATFGIWAIANIIRKNKELFKY
jgi:hypothetical protein